MGSRAWLFIQSTASWLISSDKAERTCRFLCCRIIWLLLPLHFRLLNSAESFIDDWISRGRTIICSRWDTSIVRSVQRWLATRRFQGVCCCWARLQLNSFLNEIFAGSLTTRMLRNVGVENWGVSKRWWRFWKKELLFGGVCTSISRCHSHVDPKLFILALQLVSNLLQAGYVFFKLAITSSQLIIFHNPISFVFLNWEQKLSPFTFSIFGPLFAIKKFLFEIFSFFVNLCLEFSYSPVAFTFDFFQLHGQSFSASLSLSILLFQSTHIFVSTWKSLLNFSRQSLIFSLKPLNFAFGISAQSLMSFHKLLNLALILVFHSFNESLLGWLRLFLVVISALLKLLDCEFKFALRLQQIALVIIFLGL